ncbi:hypothetical protein M2267_005654 [Ensifer sp. KUDG1]
MQAQGRYSAERQPKTVDMIVTLQRNWNGEMEGLEGPITEDQPTSLYVNETKNNRRRNLSLSQAFVPRA